MDRSEPKTLSQPFSASTATTTTINIGQPAGQQSVAAHLQTFVVDVGAIVVVVVVALTWLRLAMRNGPMASSIDPSRSSPAILASGSAVVVAHYASQTGPPEAANVVLYGSFSGSPSPSRLAIRSAGDQ